MIEIHTHNKQNLYSQTTLKYLFCRFVQITKDKQKRPKKEGETAGGASIDGEKYDEKTNRERMKGRKVKRPCYEAASTTSSFTASCLPSRFLSWSSSSPFTFSTPLEVFSQIPFRTNQRRNTMKGTTQTTAILQKRSQK